MATLRPVAQLSNADALISVGAGKMLAVGDFAGPGNLHLQEITPGGNEYSVQDVTARLHWPYGQFDGSDHSGLGVTRHGNRLIVVATPNTQSPDLFSSVSLDGGQTWQSSHGSFERCGEFAGPAALPDGRLLVFGFQACDPVDRHAWISSGGGSWRRTGPDIGVHSGDFLCSTEDAAFFARGDFVEAASDNRYSLQRSLDGVNWRPVRLPVKWPVGSQMFLQCDQHALAIYGGFSPTAPQAGLPAAVWDAKLGKLVAIDLPAGTQRLAVHGATLIATGSAIQVSENEGAAWRKLADFKDKDLTIGASAVGADGTIYVNAYGLLWATSETAPRKPEDIARDFVNARLQGAPLDSLWQVVEPTLLTNESAEGTMVTDFSGGGAIKKLSCRDYQRTGKLCAVYATRGVALVLLDRSPNGSDWLVAGAKGLFAPKDVDPNYYPPA